MNRRAVLIVDFVEAFLTIVVTSLGTIMVRENNFYIWPSAPSVVFISLLGFVNGVRVIQKAVKELPRV